jgi:uncharacterized protein YndB with AHSA1/START domain
MATEPIRSTTSRILVATRVRATPERAFQAFTREVNAWWRPNGLFQFTGGKPGSVAFESGVDGRFTETLEDGSVFEIGRISVWEPPRLLVFSWRQASFTPEQSTEVRVRFEPAGDETRVTVEHFGWETVPQEHVARHHFPDAIFLQRHAEWWQNLLGSLKQQLAGK